MADCSLIVERTIQSYNTSSTINTEQIIVVDTRSQAIANAIISPICIAGTGGDTGKSTDTSIFGQGIGGAVDIDCSCHIKFIYVSYVNCEVCIAIASVSAGRGHGDHMTGCSFKIERTIQSHNASRTVDTEKVIVVNAFRQTVANAVSGSICIAGTGGDTDLCSNTGIFSQSIDRRINIGDR